MEEAAAEENQTIPEEPRPAQAKGSCDRQLTKHKINKLGLQIGQGVGARECVPGLFLQQGNRATTLQGG